MTTKQVTDSSQIGQVVDQSPKTGQVKQGTPVTIVVGKQADKVLVPITVGHTYKQAFADLQKAGLIPQVVVSPQDDNAIVMNSNPGSGQVEPNTVVQLWTRPGDKQQPTTPGGNN